MEFTLREMLGIVKKEFHESIVDLVEPKLEKRGGDNEIDQHFFMQETSSHPVIVDEPYIMAACMETKVLDTVRICEGKEPRR